MKAVILVGGPGTRLQPLTDSLPKSMVPVLTVPVMEHTLAYLRGFGITDIILTLNYLPDIIRGYLGDGSRCGVNLTYCIEEEPLGTAGAVKNTEAYLDDQPMVVLNGDIFSDLDIGAMYRSHVEKGAKATISLNQVEDPSAFGVVEMDRDGCVGAFIEKPPKEEATTNWINAGTYILDREVLDYIPEKQHYMFERGLYPALLEKGEPVYGYRHRGYWLDMGTPGKYYSLNRDILEGRYRSPATAGFSSNGAYCHPEAMLDATVNLFGPVVLDKGASLGRKVTVNGPSVVGADCRIEESSIIDSSILWEGVSVGSGVTIKNSIIGRGVAIPQGESIENQVMTADKNVTLVL